MSTRTLGGNHGGRRMNRPPGLTVVWRAGLLWPSYGPTAPPPPPLARPRCVRESTHACSLMEARYPCLRARHSHSQKQKGCWQTCTICPRLHAPHAALACNRKQHHPQRPLLAIAIMNAAGATLSLCHCCHLATPCTDAAAKRAMVRQDPRNWTRPDAGASMRQWHISLAVVRLPGLEACH